jgi:hypothetical protein
MTESNSVPQHVSHIIIDDYNFNICYCFDSMNSIYDRNTIFLESNHTSQPEIKKKFIVYQSLSEIGLWRLSYFNGRAFYKGKNDYVQQTMINIYLQNHLDNYFMNSNKNSKEDFTNNLKDFDNFRSEILNHIDDIKRHIEIRPFFNDIIDHECGDLNNPDTIVRLKILSREIQNKYNYTIPKLINNVNKIINLDDETNAILEGDIYSTNLIPNEKAELCNKLTLYFIKYNFETKTTNSKNKIINVKNYYAPITLVENDLISEFGLYKCYVPSGAYICKILDYNIPYTRYCPQGTINCSEVYGFIGDIYNDLFPYNEISCNFLLKDKQKYIKYKKKYMAIKLNNNS